MNSTVGTYLIMPHTMPIKSSTDTNYPTVNMYKQLKDGTYEIEGTEMDAFFEIDKLSLYMAYYDSGVFNLTDRKINFAYASIRSHLIR